MAEGERIVPTVEVGIPTFERSARLRRAVESVLRQSHRDVAVVICDDGSRDDTPAVCAELAARDPRVRYLRSEVNLGLAANYNRVAAALRADFVMFLADDDWLAEDYVEVCLEELRSRPAAATVCGLAVYMDGAAVSHTGRTLALEQSSPHRRVCAYLANVDENGLMYGLMDRATMERATQMRRVLGNDWLFGASVVFQGQAITTARTTIYRDLGGVSADFPRLAASLRLPAWQARVPHLVIAAALARDIARPGAVYRELPWPGRVRLALVGALAVIRWRSLAWHLVTPAVGRLTRRRGRAWRGYLAIVRRLGGGC